MSILLLAVTLCYGAFCLSLGIIAGRRNRVKREWLELALALARKHEVVIAQAKPIVGKAIQIAHAAKMDGDVVQFTSVHGQMCQAIGMAKKMEVTLG